MKISTKTFMAGTFAILAAVSCSSFLPNAAMADEPIIFNPEQAAEEEHTPPLQGKVEEMSPADEQRYQAAVAKRAAHFKLSAEDIRDLQIGVTGTELVQKADQDFAIVEAVVPGLPAAEAGLRKGDLVVGGDSSLFWISKDPTKEAWAFTGGRAGTTVEYRVVRNGEIVSIKAARMNIEDIPNEKLRETYEDMARRLGPSGEGTVQLPDEHHATAISNMAKFLP